MIGQTVEIVSRDPEHRDIRGAVGRVTFVVDDKQCMVTLADGSDVRLSLAEVRPLGLFRLLRYIVTKS